MIIIYTACILEDGFTEAFSLFTRLYNKSPKATCNELLVALEDGEPEKTRPISKPDGKLTNTIYIYLYLPHIPTSCPNFKSFIWKISLQFFST